MLHANGLRGELNSAHAVRRRAYERGGVASVTQKILECAWMEEEKAVAMVAFISPVSIFGQLLYKIRKAREPVCRSESTTVKDVGSVMGAMAEEKLAWVMGVVYATEGDAEEIGAMGKKWISNIGEKEMLPRLPTFPFSAHHRTNP